MRPLEVLRQAQDERLSHASYDYPPFVVSLSNHRSRLLNWVFVPRLDAIPKSTHEQLDNERWTGEVDLRVSLAPGV
jgi:hypothetical protein